MTCVLLCVCGFQFVNNKKNRRACVRRRTVHILQSGGRHEHFGDSDGPGSCWKASMVWYRQHCWTTNIESHDRINLTRTSRLEKRPESPPCLRILPAIKTTWCFDIVQFSGQEQNVFPLGNAKQAWHFWFCFSNRGERLPHVEEMVSKLWGDAREVWEWSPSAWFKTQTLQLHSRKNEKKKKKKKKTPQREYNLME